jgi:hypothetical protein
MISSALIAMMNRTCAKSLPEQDDLSPISAAPIHFRLMARISGSFIFTQKTLSSNADTSRKKTFSN